MCACMHLAVVCVCASLRACAIPIISSLYIGRPVTPNVMIGDSTITWSPSAPSLSHRTSVCLVGTASCLIETSCIGCNSTLITEITENSNYSITVCSSSVVNGEPCMNESCASVLVGKHIVWTDCLDIYWNSLCSALGEMMYKPLTSSVSYIVYSDNLQ